MKYKIGVLVGDGIGPEIMAATISVLDAFIAQSDCSVEWIHLPMGYAAIESHDSAMPTESVEELAECHGWLAGPNDSASYPGKHHAIGSPGAVLRKHFDLYANIRPAKTYPDVQSTAQNVDLIIARENTEGLYSDRSLYNGYGEIEPVPGVMLTTGLFTQKASERIAHAGFRLAQTRRKYVSIVHKANVLRMAHGLFRDACYEVAKEYPDVRVDDYHVDAMAALLVRRPSDFDVIVTTNMFGDILSDLATELVGSLGMGGSINAGASHAMAQAVHGAAPDIAGQGIANPMGMLHSAAMLFQWLGDRHDDAGPSGIAESIIRGIEKTLGGGHLPADLGGRCKTQEFAEHVVGAG